MALALCLLNPWPTVNIYLEITIVQVFNAKFFIMVNLKNRKLDLYQLLEN